MISSVNRTSQLLANLAALATASAVHAQTKVLFVDDDAPAGGDGSTWGNAFRYLDDALTEANQTKLGDVEVHIAQGVYTPGKGSLNTSSRFNVQPTSSSAATISLFGGFAGVGAANPGARDVASFITVLSADLARNDSSGVDYDNAFQILRVWAPMGVTIDGLHFRGLRRNGDEYRYALFLKMRADTPRENGSATYDALVRDCTFEDHALTSGHLVFVQSWSPNGRMIFDHCVFQDIGGDDNVNALIRVESGRISVERSRFIMDQNWFEQPMIRTGSAVNLADSEFLGVHAAVAEQSYTPLSAPTLIDRCLFLFRKNDSGQPPISVTNARIRDSIMQAEAPPASAIVAPLVGILPGAGFVSVENCNVGGGEDAIVGQTDKLKWLGGNITSDPGFVDMDGPDDVLLTWDDNDLRLDASSPCIDAGRRISPVRGMIDLIGGSRFFDGDWNGVVRLDMGPREYQVVCPADFDNSGFVDTEDFDAFIRAFEAGC
ncbi:MAG TPA: hypothetical protein VK176_01065 [Phycisphaerales bacterium]|nr:hypothetical protein [Phycisphaerales bacterium]